MYSSGDDSSAGIPRFRKKLPKTLLKTTMTAQIQVFTRSRADSGFIPSVAGARRERFVRLLVGDEFLTLRAQRQILASLLGEALPVVVVEDRLLHDAPSHLG